jgi:alpha/beta superfamily hydrolase
MVSKWLMVWVLLSGLVNAQTTPDYEKESRWAMQVESALMEGDILWLEVDSHRFLNLFMPSEAKHKRAVVIVHGLGAHPNWQQVIQPLRIALNERGLSTLSIQMPVLSNEADISQYQALFDLADKRIATARAYLIAQGFEADVLLAHSLGSVMSAHYLANNAHSFNRFVSVGMPEQGVQYLNAIKLPWLDLYGDDDIQSVLGSAVLRKEASRHNKNYQQKQVSANHFFDDKEELLIQVVSDWILSL